MYSKALRFESRFSLPPNSLGFCGDDTAAGKFKKCIIEGKCEGVEEEVKRFIVLHPYLKTIAQITKRPAFSYPVFESYWLGNDLLRKAKLQDYDFLLEMFLEQGVPDFFVDELRIKKPNRFIPTHLFQVLHVGVGRASGAVPFNLKSINDCMIRWGKVKELKSPSSAKATAGRQKSPLRQGFAGQAKIALNSLKQVDNKYELCEKDEIIPFNNGLVKGVKEGDVVAVHWNMAVKILNKDEEKKLEFWTKEVISADLTPALSP